MKLRAKLKKVLPLVEQLPMQDTSAQIHRLWQINGQNEQGHGERENTVHQVRQAAGGHPDADLPRCNVVRGITRIAILDDCSAIFESLYPMVSARAGGWGLPKQ